MRNVTIKGIARKKASNTLTFDGQTRYRFSKQENHLGLLVDVSKRAIESSGLSIHDINCIVSASAVGVQPIPATAVLIHEKIAKGTNIPALDINTTCTSFITAFDIMSQLIHIGVYKNVLIVSGDAVSLGLNPNQKESYELFSDAAAAIVLSKSENPNQGVLYSDQMTWSEGAHATEIRGGLTNFAPALYTEDTKAEYNFDMKGRNVLSLAVRKVPELFNKFHNTTGMQPKDIDLVIPHQASKALDMLLAKIGFAKGSYINKVKEYGNMVSASVPYILCEAIEEGIIQKGNTIMLAGTAAGLTANILVFIY